jgi:hypothetical protein
MNEELTLAIEELRLRPSETVWFLPVMLTLCKIPEREIGGGKTLHSIQYVDLSRDWHAGVRQLIAAVRPGEHLRPAEKALSTVRKRALYLIDADLPDEEYPSEAMRELESYGVAILDDLIAALENEDGTVRWRAATLIGKLGPDGRPAIPALVAAIRRLMNNPQFAATFECQYCLAALSEIGDPHVIPVFIDVLFHPEVNAFQARWHVVRPMGRFGNHAIRKLQASFPGAIPSRAVRAAMALAELDKSQRNMYVEFLREQLRTADESVRTDARTALTEIREPIEPIHSAT